MIPTPAPPPETERPAAATTDLDLLPPSALLARLAGAYDAVPAAVRSALPVLERTLAAMAPRWLAGGRILLVGAGTSGRVAALQAAECPPTFGVPPERVLALVAGGSAALARAVEGAEDDAPAGEAAVLAVAPTSQDTLIAVSASGTAPFCCAALAVARRSGALGVAVTANPDSPLAQGAEIPLVLPTGPEPVAGSTRMLAGSAQKTALDILTTSLMVQAGHVHGNRMVDFVASNRKLRARAIRTVVDLGGTTPERAQALLAACAWQVKVACVMAARDCAAGTASGLLAAASGRLRAVLEEGRVP